MLNTLSDLDLRLIRLFLAVVDAGGLTPAQSTLGVGQPTISTQLAALETRLGFRLCERGRAGFRLTAKGARFAEAARRLVAMVNEFAAEARQLDRQLVGQLHIGLIGHTSTVQTVRLSEAIARFCRRSQAVRFSVSVRPPGELEERLLANDMQLAVGYFWHRIPQLEYTQLFAEHQAAYCGRAHPLFELAPHVQREHLTNCEWVWRSYPLPQAQDLPAPRRITAIADNMEAVALLILSGVHCGYLPVHYAAPYVESGLLAPLNPAELRYEVPFHLVTRHRRHHDDILRALLEDLRACHLGEPVAAPQPSSKPAFSAQ